MLVLFKMEDKNIETIVTCTRKAKVINFTILLSNKNSGQGSRNSPYYSSGLRKRKMHRMKYGCTMIPMTFS